MAELRIGELAERFRLNPKTIRYYEKMGLLVTRQRSPNGYRLYDSSEVWRLEFILKAKEIGLTLEEIREILTLRDSGRSPCDRVMAMTDRKLALVGEQIRALQAFREELLALRDEASKTKDASACVCGIIESHRPHAARSPLQMPLRARS